ncbi:MAG: DUF4358 domain-containing protein [Clostridiales bacterium]|nr:DUF4358 domain-containing protein [Clostridiales bacterium]
MKKTFVIMSLILAALLILITSCGSKTTDDVQGNEAVTESSETAVADVATDVLLDAAISAYSEDEIPNVKYYRSSIEDAEADGYLDIDQAGQLFRGEYGVDFPEFNTLEEFSIIVPSGKNAFEIDILKVKNENDVEAALQILKDRLSQKDNGEIETYVPEEKPIIDGAEFYQKGKYIALICTADNSKAKATLDSLLG